MKCYFVLLLDEPPICIGYFQTKTSGEANYQAYKAYPASAEFFDYMEFAKSISTLRCPTLDGLGRDIVAGDEDSFLREQGLCTGKAGAEQYHRSPQKD